jgi:glycosyltransferase involved in cell wall biosynthesis
MALSEPRVLLVTSWVFPSIGGVSSHLRLLAGRLGVAEREVVGFRQICEAQAHGRARVLFGLRRRTRAAFGFETVSLWARTLKGILQQRSVDIVHCHDAMATWAALRARENSRRGGRPFRVVSTTHGPVSRHMVEAGADPASPDVRLVERRERQAWVGADAIIAVDQGQRAIAVGQGAHPGKVVVIPNAVDVARLDTLASGRLPEFAGAGRPWVVVPRRLAPKNGVEFAIRGLAHLAAGVRPRLLLAGSGPERPRLERLAADLNLSGDVVFLGDLDHAALLPLVKGAVAVLVPSVPVFGIEEATSIAALEAMALGVPVVASRIGGLPQMIDDGAQGLLVPPGDPAALAAALGRVLGDAALGVRLGAAARARVEREFSAERWFELHRATYRGLGE